MILPIVKCPICGSVETASSLTAIPNGVNRNNMCLNDTCSHSWSEDIIPDFIMPYTHSFSSKVDDKGRITIRSDVREELGIKPGDKVRVIEIEKVQK